MLVHYVIKYVPYLNMQLVLQCTVSSDRPGGSTGELVEVILERSITVAECCAAMVMAAGLTGEELRHRKHPCTQSMYTVCLCTCIGYWVWY